MVLMTQQLEKRYVNQWLNEKKSGIPYFTRVWIGPLPPGKDANMFMVVGKWVDAILIEPHLITIVEAKLKPNPKGIGQLLVYEQEFRKTMRFQRYWDRPIKKLLLTTRIDDAVLESAEANNIEYEVFAPDWIKFL